MVSLMVRRKRRKRSISIVLPGAPRVMLLAMAARAVVVKGLQGESERTPSARIANLNAVSGTFG